MSDGSITPEMKIAAATAKRIRLLGISCVSLKALIVSGEHPLFLKPNVAKVFVQWFVVGEKVSAIFPFCMTVDGASTADSAHTKHAEVEVMYRIDYELAAPAWPTAREELPHFLAITGYMHSWPYFRAEVQSLTTKIGLPALTLPILVSGQVPARVSVAAQPFEMPDVTPAALPVGTETE